MQDRNRSRNPPSIIRHLVKENLTGAGASFGVKRKAVYGSRKKCGCRQQIRPPPFIPNRKV